VFFIGIMMSIIWGFPEWHFAVNPETKQLGLTKMACGTGATLLFVVIGFAVSRGNPPGNRRYDG